MSRLQQECDEVEVVEQETVGDAEGVEVKRRGELPGDGNRARKGERVPRAEREQDARVRPNGCRRQRHHALRERT